MPRKYSELCPPDLRPQLRFELPELEYPERLNAVETVLEGAFRAGWQHRTAYYEGEHRFTFAEVRADVHRKAAALRSLGVSAGDSVLLRMPDSFGLVTLLLAVQAIGGVAVPTYIQLRADDLIYRARDTGASLLVTTADLMSEALPVEAATGGMTRVVAVSREAGTDCECLSEFLPEGTAAPDYMDTHGEDLCLILYTSGSSGTPKGTSHCHRDMLAVADSYWRHGVAPGLDDVVAGPPSIAFALGFGLFVYFPLRLGHAAVLDADKGLERAAETIRRHDVTILVGVVSWFGALSRMARETRPDLSGLRHAMTGGEPLSREVERAWLEVSGLPLEQFIGTTEVLHCFLSSTRPGGRARPSTLGQAVPGWRIDVLDPDSLTPVPDGDVGLLAVQGPTGTVYWNRPDEQARVVIRGWNVFQDLVRRDDQGDLHYVARNDEMIVSAGYNISPAQVEDLLLHHRAVAECCCVAAPDPTGRRGTIVKAHIVPAPGVTADAGLITELQDHVKANGPPYLYPRQIAFETELPRTINGKIQRAELRRRNFAASEQRNQEGSKSMT